MVAGLGVPIFRVFTVQHISPRNGDSILQNYSELIITNFVPLNISVFDFSFQKFYQYYKQKVPKSLLTQTKMGCQDYLNAFIKSCKTYWEVVKKVIITQGSVVQTNNVVSQQDIKISKVLYAKTP